MNQISSVGLQEMLDSTSPPHLLDVREVYEHEVARLPSSCLIPLGELAERFEEIAHWKNEPVVVYCHHGIRSQHAIAFLSSVGFSDLTNLEGGIDAWSVSVDPDVARY